MNKDQIQEGEIKEEKAITIVQGEAEALIAQAIDKNVSVDVMERLLVIRRELKQERAKEAYDRAMAAFQAECPTIKKTKEVVSNGKVIYRYAPIESIVEQVKEALKTHGFSYSTNMKLLPDGVEVSLKVTHSGGHSEVTEMTVPLGTKTNVMSQTQVVAAAQTFAKRYAFVNALGILTGDEDSDARPMLTSQQNASSRPTATPQKSSWQTAKENPGYYKEPPIGGKITPKQASYLRSLLKQKNYTEAELCAKYKVKTIEELTGEQARKIIDNLLKLKPKAVSQPEEEPLDLDTVDEEIEQMKEEAA